MRPGARRALLSSSVKRIHTTPTATHTLHMRWNQPLRALMPAAVRGGARDRGDAECDADG